MASRRLLTPILSVLLLMGSWLLFQQGCTPMKPLQSDIVASSDSENSSTLVPSTQTSSSDETLSSDDLNKSQIERLDFRGDYKDASTEEKARLMNHTRSHFQDQFPKNGLKLPDSYLPEAVNETIVTDPFAGFRVQILSTRNVLEADSVKDQFRVLSDSLFTGYNPSAYIHFRSPYYRVRVGDFSKRERANQFSGLIKDLYPDAWVVHDRIRPDHVPPDSVSVRSLRLNP